MNNITSITQRGVRLLLAAALMLVPASCNIVSGEYSTATGRPYEMVVSADQRLWDGPVGDTLRSILGEPVHMINQFEPMYDVVPVNPSGLKGILLRHRNILEIKMMPEIEKPASSALYDVYARPQIIVTVAAPDAKSLLEYISANRAEIQQVFEMTERNRSLSAAKSFKEQDIENEIFRTFGMKLDIPKGYLTRNSIGGDFMWISNEQALSSQGLAIYSYPYTDVNDFSMESLLARRNEFVKRIPGPPDGSHMTTADFEPDIRYLRINDRRWAEMRGLWDLEGGFMGGPFVSFSTLDTASGRVITVDCYVFSPKNPKRNLMRTVEHIVYSAEFPAAGEQ